MSSAMRILWLRRYTRTGGPWTRRSLFQSSAVTPGLPSSRVKTSLGDASYGHAQSAKMTEAEVEADLSAVLDRQRQRETQLLKQTREKLKKARCVSQPMQQPSVASASVSASTDRGSKPSKKAAKKTAAPDPDAQVPRDELLCQALDAYCQACLAAGEVPLARNALGSYQLRSRRPNQPEPYSLPLFHSHWRLLLASPPLHGHDDMFKQCLDLWRRVVAADAAEVAAHGRPALTERSFVLALSCLALCPENTDSRQLAADIKERMQELDISLTSLYERSHFLPGERQKLDRVLQCFFPDERPPEPTFRSTAYQTPLLSSLNERCADADAAVMHNLDDPAYREAAPALLQRQMEVERRGHLEIASALPHVPERSELTYFEMVWDEWRKSLHEAVEQRVEYQRSMLSHRDDHSQGLSAYPFLAMLPPSEYVDVILDEISQLTRSEDYSPSVTNVQLSLGREVMKRYRLKQMSIGQPSRRERLAKTYQDYLEWYLDPSGRPKMNLREAFQHLANHHPGPSLDCPEADWPVSVLLMVGRELMIVLMRTLQIQMDSDGDILIGQDSVCVTSDNQVSVRQKSCQSKVTSPAFYKVFRQSPKNHFEVEQIKPHPYIVKLFSLNRFASLKFKVNELPMLVPPLPWLSENTGAHFFSQPQMIRSAFHDEKSELHKQNADKLLPIIDSLNQLGSTPWRVNKPVLDLVLEVFNEQERYEKYLSTLGVPQRDPKPPAALADTKWKMGGRLDREDVSEYRDMLLHKQAFNQLKSECFSLWCDTLYRLSIAKHFRDEVLYFPHNIDFRGRVYPIAPYLNHMNCDLARSLLVFAKGKPLGPKGLDWLKLHAVNLSGLKKRDSVEARLEYANEVLDDILDSAARPFEGRQWWLQSEDPWQTLGVCFEIRAALESGDPANFVSHLPIHQDGSCNGLQHYAALGRDVLGASSVNLLPADLPQDVYSDIAAIVERKRQEDKATDLTRALDGYVSRKVIKQTVMTTVYGVTHYGASLQIGKKLRKDETFPVEMVDKASVYLARLTFESLNEMFASSQKIQVWFTQCARALGDGYQRPVQWETPLGLFVVQPYFAPTRGLYTRSTSIKYRLVNNHNKINLVNNQLPPKQQVAKPNVVKQCNGFPPNFIHSLDSSHMMMTTLHLWNRGLTFASVHDCYWTHACSVEEMNEVCREQFVNLHSHPILENLAESFATQTAAQDKADEKEEERKSSKKRVQRLKDKMLFQSIPAKGSLDLNEVKKSTYFFS